MAEQEAHSLSSTFPNPPTFWKEFTTEKLTRYEKLRQEYADKNGLNTEKEDGASFRIPELPEDLANLQPPPEPTDGRWRVFGDQYMLDDQLPTLEDQGIKNLPSSGPASGKDVKHSDRALELKRLAKSLLLNFLELSGTLSRSPADAEAKVQDLRTIFINIHHILNEYRPHQARESAIKMMEDHLDRTRAETIAIRTQVDKAKRVLEGLGSIGIPVDTTEQKPQEQKSETADRGPALEREAEVWAAVDALLI